MVNVDSAFQYRMQVAALATLDNSLKCLYYHASELSTASRIDVLHGRYAADEIDEIQDFARLYDRKMNLPGTKYV